MGGRGARAFVVRGKTDGDLLEQNDLFVGIGGFALLGTRGGGFPAALGDVNGDGLGDYGVTFAGRNSMGGLQVIWGRDDFDSATESVQLDGETDGFFIEGIEPFLQLGEQVAAGGDVNGDGLSDIQVTATNTRREDGTAAGTVFVVFGKEDATTVEVSPTLMTEGSGFLVRGERVLGPAGGGLSTFGRTIAAADDLNGDGLSDFLISDYVIDTVYAVFGKANTDLISQGELDAGDGGRPVFANHDGGRNQCVGCSLARIGDMNGDSIADYFIGAPFARINENSNRVGAGAGYVVYGPFATAQPPAMVEEEPEPVVEPEGQDIF